MGQASADVAWSRYRHNVVVWTGCWSAASMRAISLMPTSRCWPRRPPHRDSSAARPGRWTPRGCAATRRPCCGCWSIPACPAPCSPRAMPAPAGRYRPLPSWCSRCSCSGPPPSWRRRATCRSARDRASGCRSSMRPHCGTSSRHRPGGCSWPSSWPPSPGSPVAVTGPGRAGARGPGGSASLTRSGWRACWMPSRRPSGPASTAGSATCRCS